MIQRALPESAMFPPRFARGPDVLLAGAVVLLALVMIRSAWICDDALIT
jgi:hypothetical protein